MTTLNKQKIIDALMNVYDPEFPIVDIYTMGLIYDIDIQSDKVILTMTLSSPSCPFADQITQMTQNEVSKITDGKPIEINLTFEPLRNPNMIKDEDLKKMFE